MKHMLTIAGATVATFVVVLVGAYVAMPTIAPEVAAQADSLAAADTTSEGDPTIASNGSAAGADSLALAGADPARAAAGDSVALPRSDADVIAALRDSVRRLNQQLTEAHETTQTLQEEAESLQSQLAEATNQNVKANELSSALLKMERRELAALLKEVDMSVLARLYKEASRRSRTRLLQAIPPDRAARFVNEFVSKPETSAPSAAPAVSSPSPSSK